MSHSKRALLLGAFVALTVAFAASAASAATINPLGPITANGLTLQVITIPSIQRTYTCIWQLRGQILRQLIVLGAGLQDIGGITAAAINCNQPGVTITPLVSSLTSVPGPWKIGVTTVLGLPNPTGALVTLLGVKIKLADPAIGFRCLYTGTLGLLIQNGNPTVQLLTSTFAATPELGDTCPVGLQLIKGPGQYNLNPPLFIGP